MRVTSFNLPEKMLNNIDKLCQHGIFKSRSEAVRAALQELIDKKFKSIENGEIVVENNGTEKTRKRKPSKLDMRVIRTGWERKKNE